MLINLESITKEGKALLLAYDQGLEHGPLDFNSVNFDPKKIIEIADSGFFTGLILHKGIAQKYFQNGGYKVPLIIKLNGKTNLVKDQDPYSALVCTVDEAIKLGAKAVGYTIYIGSEFEPSMIQEFGEIVCEAHKKGIPVIAWMYPRGRNIKNESDPKIIAYAARVGLELGADIVKIKYTGDPKSFKWVVDCAGRTKVVVMGGSKESEKIFLNKTKIILNQGAIGLAVGRNIWQDPRPLEIAEKINKIIFSENE